jgi:hypothetical protein
MKKKLVDQAGSKSQLEVCAIFEDMLSKTRSWQQQQLSPLSGPDLAKLMKIGTRVIRQVLWTSNPNSKSLLIKKQHQMQCCGSGIRNRFFS